MSTRVPPYQCVDYDSDSEESITLGTLAISRLMSGKWKPTVENQHNDHSDVEERGIVEFGEEVNSIYTQYIPSKPAKWTR